MMGANILCMIPFIGYYAEDGKFPTATSNKQDSYGQP